MHKFARKVNGPGRKFSGGCREWKTEGAEGYFGLFDLGQVFQPDEHAGEVFGVAQDDEDGVIASERAHDLGPLFPIERFGDCLGATGEGTNDDEIAGAFCADIQGREQASDGGSLVPAFRRQSVVGAAFRIRDFNETELANIAREGGLGDVEMPLRKQLAQLFLATDAVLLHEFADDLVTLRLVHTEDCWKRA
jgi:hypothetical protein